MNTFKKTLIGLGIIEGITLICYGMGINPILVFHPRYFNQPISTFVFVIITIFVVLLAFIAYWENQREQNESIFNRRSSSKS